jgi:hypothetical protein
MLYDATSDRLIDSGKRCEIIEIKKNCPKAEFFHNDGVTASTNQASTVETQEKLDTFGDLIIPLDVRLSIYAGFIKPTGLARWYTTYQPLKPDFKQTVAYKDIAMNGSVIQALDYACCRGGLNYAISVGATSYIKSIRAGNAVFLLVETPRSEPYSLSSNAIEKLTSLQVDLVKSVMSGLPKSFLANSRLTVYTDVWPALSGRPMTFQDFVDAVEKDGRTILEFGKSNIYVKTFQLLINGTFPFTEQVTVAKKLETAYRKLNEAIYQLDPIRSKQDISPTFFKSLKQYRDTFVAKLRILLPAARQQNGNESGLKRLLHDWNQSEFSAAKLQQAMGNGVAGLKTKEAAGFWAIFFGSFSIIWLWGWKC